MKKTFLGVLVALSINLLAVLASAAQAPVTVSHKLTGYTKTDTAVTLEFSLHVVNQGERPITDLSLSLVPRPPFMAGRVSVSVGQLTPKQSSDVTVKLVTPLLLEEHQVSQRHLFWAGEYLDAQGNLVEFPVKSQPGGAK